MKSMKKRSKKRYSLRTKIMMMNLVIAFTSLVACGVLFIVSVDLLVSKYVNHDLDFMLTEVSDNLNEKMGVMEDMIYRIRKSDEIMDYMNHPVGERNIHSKSIEKTLQEVIEINSEQNLAGWNEPIVESVCLFDKNGNFFSDFYYALTFSDMERQNRIFQRIQDAFGTGKEQEYYCRVENETLYFSYPLYNDNMSTCGNIIFELNEEAIKEPMKELLIYKDSFWGLFSGKELVQSEGRVDKSAIFAQEGDFFYEPYTKKYNGKSYRVYKMPLSLEFNLIVGAPENQVILIVYDSLKVYIWGVIGVILAGTFGFTFFSSKMTLPMKEVAGKMEQVQEGNFETKLPEYDSIEFHEISVMFNSMTEYINYLINQVYEKQLSIKEMELKFIQTQMNPHFMFNVLNSIALQARMDGNDEVFKMISSFAQLIRAKVYRSGNEKVKIKQELKYVDYYLYLQSFRFQDRLKYEIQIESEELLEYYIPKLCMQLIVENAVVHGIEPLVGEGIVKINLYAESDSLYIDIEDNGVGFEKDGIIELPIEMKQEDSSHNHVGLNNANRLIRLLYGEEYGIEIHSRKKEGTLVKIHIPFDEKL